MVEPSENPLGFCKKCKKFPLMRMDGKLKCPQCDVEPEDASNRVVNVTVSDDDFKLVVTPLGYVERVPSDDPRPVATKAQISAAQALLDKEGKTQTPVRSLRETPIPDVPVLHVTVPPPDRLLTLPYELVYNWLKNSETITEVSVVLTSSQLTWLYEYIDGLPNPKNMKEARVLIKLQDQIAELLKRG